MKVLTSLVLVCGMGAAQAANYVTLSGANVDFFVDADYFDVSAATVTGNAISFAFTAPEYTLNVAGNLPGGRSEGTLFSDRGKLLYVVAHDGYSVLPRFRANADAWYDSTAETGRATASINTYAFRSTYSNGEFSSSPDSNGFQFLQLNRTGIADGEAQAFSGYGDGYRVPVGALGLDLNLSAQVVQEGVSSTTLSIRQLGYSFTVAAVPEPEAWLMVLAGLGVMGWALRLNRAS